MDIEEAVIPLLLAIGMHIGREEPVPRAEYCIDAIDHFAKKSGYDFAHLRDAIIWELREIEFIRLKSDPYGFPEFFDFGDGMDVSRSRK